MDRTSSISNQGYASLIRFVYLQQRTSNSFRIHRWCLVQNCPLLPSLLHLFGSFLLWHGRHLRCDHFPRIASVHVSEFRIERWRTMLHRSVPIVSTSIEWRTVFLLGMGFRPMQVLDDTSITVYNDTSSFDDSVSSLDNYRICERRTNGKIDSDVPEHLDMLTQSDLSFVDECSPTQPSSSLQSGRSCRFSWTEVVPNECKRSPFYECNAIRSSFPSSTSMCSEQILWMGGRSTLCFDQIEPSKHNDC